MTAGLVCHRLQPWPKGCPRYRARAACHRNAQLLALDRPDLRVAKGYALTPDGRWLGHWWCVDGADGVIDPTWKNAGVAYVALAVIDSATVAARIIHSTHFEREVDETAPEHLVPALRRAAGMVAS